MRKAQLFSSTKPPTASKEGNRDRHGFRGTPPPASFSLQDLPDDAQLTEGEVASVGRWSISTVASWRRQPDHPLQWERVAGKFIRYRAGKLKAFMAMPAKRRLRTPPKRHPRTDQQLPAEYLGRLSRRRSSSQPV
jgi:hypothetical protein